MDTERTNTQIPECEFEWGTCAVIEAEGIPSPTHMCRGDKSHEGLHVCGDCGVVYLKRVI